MRPIHLIAALAVTFFASEGTALAQSAVPSSPIASEPRASQVLSIDTPIETLVAIPMAKAALDADIPGLTDHPMYDQFKRENLRALAPKFGGAITDKDLAKLQADLAALSPATSSN